MLSAVFNKKSLSFGTGNIHFDFSYEKKCSEKILPGQPAIVNKGPLS